MGLRCMHQGLASRRGVAAVAAMVFATFATFATLDALAQLPPRIREPRLPPALTAPPPPAVVQQPVVPGESFACTADGGDPTGLSGRDLAGAMQVDYAGMTNQACRTFCGQRGFAYAGTQYGGYCFCGNSFGARGPAVTASPPRTCNLGCAGRPNEVCGGEWANSVSLTGVAPAAPTDGIQCRVWKDGTYNNNAGASGSYVASELHRWKKIAVLSTGPTTRSYRFRYTMQVSGSIDANAAGTPWGETWSLMFGPRDETWTANAGTNPATGGPGWTLYRAQSETTPVASLSCTNWSGNPPRTWPCGGSVDAFLLPSAATGVWTVAGSAWTYSFMDPNAPARMKHNPLGSSNQACTWNVAF